ncbi:hypothetical protein HYFRA_00011987 [Hymenoscyphus fraxineus]|uniref:Uncharacterized protein n=1 Tax=Hymenoscyphus fraxineus TaxID=746836 RepID=A0A9N9L4M6_9HELO|nr:hypothetical protein HYFRA_00011987 [Hymenoscyphus fraxineus]
MSKVPQIKVQPASGDDNDATVPDPAPIQIFDEGFVESPTEIDSAENHAGPGKLTSRSDKRGNKDELRDGFVEEKGSGEEDDREKPSGNPQVPTLESQNPKGQYEKVNVPETSNSPLELEQTETCEKNTRTEDENNGQSKKGLTPAKDPSRKADPMDVNDYRIKEVDPKVVVSLEDTRERGGPSFPSFVGGK